ncbi:MAG: FG-GAP-like repeat-containing protein [Tannerella sp.]|jgi:hypothetical protein|nr:FG-GAP-like repeat-containing protein [Tannerella sp.]
MKRLILMIGLVFYATVSAFSQWSWGGQIYYGYGSSVGNISFNSDVELWIAEGRTLTVGNVATHGFSLTKHGGGTLVISGDNPEWDGDIIYGSRADSIVLAGTLGHFVNDSVGHLYTGSIISSPDSVNVFVINQPDAEVQTFDTYGYRNSGRGLTIIQSGKSCSRFVRSSHSLMANIELRNAGVVYIDGEYHTERIAVTNGGTLIMGENSADGIRDVVSFDRNGPDSPFEILNFAKSTVLQIGNYYGPTLAQLSGTVIHSGTLKIDVYDPGVYWDLTADMPDWAGSFSDKIEIDSGEYIFNDGAGIDIAFDPAFESAVIQSDADYFLPLVIVDRPALSPITGANRVKVVQNFPGWNMSFFVGDGMYGTRIGWGYIKMSKILPDLYAFSDFTNTARDNPVAIPVKNNDRSPNKPFTPVAITGQPHHGTAAVVSGDTVVYMPARGYTGLDTMTYRITFGADTSYAKIYITVSEWPDNIDLSADCFGNAEATAWSIEKKYQSQASLSDRVHSSAQPLVGDLDGDGIPEIVTMNYAGSPYFSDRILIFRADLTLYGSIPVPTAESYATLPLAVGDVDGDGRGEIIYGSGYRNGTAGGTLPADERYRLYAFRMDGSQVWKSDRTYIETFNGSRFHSASINISDLDGDGRVEIAVGDRVFAGESGVMLATLLPGGRGRQRNAASATDVDGYMPAIGDINGDGIQEIAAGNTTYQIRIASRTDPSLNRIRITGKLTYLYDSLAVDGYTSVADIDMDGKLDVVVVGRNPDVNPESRMYVWQGTGIRSNQIGDIITGDRIAFPAGYGGHVPTQGHNGSRAFVGDINRDGTADIVYASNYLIAAVSYVPGNRSFGFVSRSKTSDASGSAATTAFDFNLDGSPELVHRDDTHLHVYDLNGQEIASLECQAVAGTESPVIVDLNGDGEAEILVSGADPSDKPNDGGDVAGNCRLMVFGSSARGGKWASARRVWNQHGYNVANINEDLTVPRYPMNAAAIFPGGDGVINTGDDVHPYNGFMQQMTVMNRNGNTMMYVPDVYIDRNASLMTLTGDSLSVTVAVVNRGTAATGSPVYITLYRENVSTQSKILTHAADISIKPGETAYVTVGIKNIKPYFPMVYVAARVNDDGSVFPAVQECDATNNVVRMPGSIASLVMKKDAMLNGVPDNGALPNPVSALFNENIQYKITTVNVNYRYGTVTVRDTLPLYMDYVAGSSSPAAQLTNTAGAPSRQVLEWTLPNISPMNAFTVSYTATPQSGSCASQPLFVNRAWVTVSDTVTVETNGTYHQGAGISLINFSSGAGGILLNAHPQALDYKTHPRSGVIVASDDGYEFAGWSHDSYVSLRGDTVGACEGIMSYEAIRVYGNVTLKANFELAKSDGSLHKVDSLTNAGDDKSVLPVLTDDVWSAGRVLYVRTANPGSVVRIYSAAGASIKQQHTITEGDMSFTLPPGIYVVTINNGAGRKVVIE